MVDYEKEKLKDEVRNLALKRLSSKLRTEKEIVDLLKDKGYDSSLIDNTLNFLKEYNYINDRYYVRSYYITENLSGKGKSRIVSALKKKGIDESDISLGMLDAINEEDSKIIDDRTLASNLYQKLKREYLESGKELDDKFKAKAIRRMINKGFKYDDIFKAINGDSYDK